MRKMTKEEYEILLKEHNPNLTIVSNFQSSRKTIEVKDLDGIIYKVEAASLLKNIAPTIRTAIDKTAAFNIKMQKIFPNLRIEDEYLVGDKKMKVLDDLSIEYFVKPESILSGSFPTIESAIDKNTAFKLKAQSIHRSSYDYHLVDYKGDKVKVKIICEEHGIFEQRPNNHITQKQGCPLCNQARGWSKTEWLNFSKDKSCLLYIIKCWDELEEFIKIGITSDSTPKRFRSKREMPYNFKILNEIQGTGEEVWNLEKNYHEQYKQFKYLPKMKFKGIQECFDLTIYNSIC